MFFAAIVPLIQSETGPTARRQKREGAEPLRGPATRTKLLRASLHGQSSCELRYTDKALGELRYGEGASVATFAENVGGYRLATGYWIHAALISPQRTQRARREDKAERGRRKAEGGTPEKEK